MVSNVATWILMSLWNVATLPLNVATLLIPLSVTSRRCPERSDVAPNVATSFSSTLCNVATLPRTSRRCPVLKPRTVHFGPSPRPLHYPKPLRSFSPVLTSLAGALYHAGRRLFIAFRPLLCIPEFSSHTGSGSLWHFHHIELGSSLRAFSVGLGVS